MLQSNIVRFQKISIPTQGRSLEITRWRGTQKPNFLKESMKLNWKFQRGRGSNQKTLCRGYGNFLEPHIDYLDSLRESK